MKKAFQTHIIMRYMDADAVNGFLETYNNARYSTGSEKRVVCQRDRDIYKKYLDGAFIQDLAEEYQRSYWWINRSIQLAKQELEDF